MNRSSGGSGTSIRPQGTSGRAPIRTPQERAARVAAQERFFRDLVSEMRRVTWPSRQEWVAATILTIGLVASIGLYTFVLDQVFGWIFGRVHQ